MIRRSVSLIFVLLVAAQSVALGDILRSAPAKVGSGATGCHIINNGTTSWDNVVVRIKRIDAIGEGQEICDDVEPGDACLLRIGGGLVVYCEVELTGGSSRTVLGGLTVEDDGLNSQLFLPVIPEVINQGR